MDGMMDLSFHVDEDVNLKPVTRDYTIYDWPIDDLKLLCERIKEATLRLNKPTTTPFNKSEAKLKWDEIAFSGHTGEECSTKWQQVCSNVRTFRTLAEIVGDAELWLKSNPRKTKEAKVQGKSHPDKPPRPPTVFFRYLMEQTPKQKAEHPELNHRQIVSLISEKYKSISSKKMAKLKEASEREYKEYKVKLEEFYLAHPEVAPAKNIGPTPVRGNSGYVQFITEKSKDPKFSGLSREELKERWNSLKEKKKIHYIELALANFHQNQPGSNFQMVKPSRDCLTREEREFYDKHLGKPDRPPTSGFNLFKSMAAPDLKNLSMIERNKQLSQRWNMLNRSDQNKFNNEVKILKQTFDRKMTEYMEKLAKREQDLIVNKSLGTNFVEVNGDSATLARSAVTESPAKRSREESFSFKQEPIVAPLRKKKKRLTALQWYQESNLDEWKEQNPLLSDHDLNTAIAEHFGTISEKKKIKWARRAEEENQRRNC